MSTLQSEDRARRAGYSASGLTLILESDGFLTAVAAAHDASGFPASEVIRELTNARDILEEVATEKDED